jgi:prolyl oligopeptidase
METATEQKTTVSEIARKQMRFLFPSIFVCLLIAGSCSGIFAQSMPPKARVDNVTDEYFGVKVTDPYRWMEDLKADETQKWIRAQAEYADRYLQNLPVRDELLKRLREVSAASAQVSQIRRHGNHFFYLRRAPDEQDFKLYVREGLTGAERVLIDPNKVLADGKRYSIQNWNASYDGNYVAYNITASGSETNELFVVETATGKDLGVRIWGTLDANWLPDGKAFFYQKRRRLPDDAPQIEKYRELITYLHRIGSKVENDKPVFGFGLNPEIKDGTDLLWIVRSDPTWDFALGELWSGVTPDREYYVAPFSSLNQTPVPWRKIVDFKDEVSSIDIRGDDLYLRTYKNAPRYKVLRTSLKQPNLNTAQTIFTGGEAVLQRIETQKDALYVGTLDAGNYRIHRIEYETGKSEPIKIPYEGAAYIGATDARDEGIYFNLVSWTKSVAHFRYDPKTKTAQPTNLIPPSPVDMSGIEFSNAKARSHDGTLVPLVIIYKKGLKRDGKNPTIMNGYGSYGFENISPIFYTDALPWLERGGMYVFTGVRGGGEYGEEWAKAGFQQTKPNTWKDFIACAEYLIAEKYTSPKHLGIQGASAGGILISNSIAERPELFGAAHIKVGMTNTVRSETTSNGIVNVPQFGSVKTEAGFNALLAMDGYLKIKDGVKYPAVLLSHGINDARVDPWMSAKMAARLQAASASGKPVLLRIDYDTGHGSGSTRDQQNKLTADEYSFFFEQLK